MDIQVSIIIVSFNTQKLLRNCINSVYNFTNCIHFEIIVIDNASMDGSVEMIKKEFPNVILIESKENLGFGKANNLGLNIAKGDFIFLLNSDTYLLNNAVKLLYDFIFSNPHIGSCGGNLFDENLIPTLSFSRTDMALFVDLDALFNFNLSKLFFGKNIFFNYSNKPIIFKGVIIGADLMIRTKIIKEVGAFDPDFFMYHEEGELQFRIIKKGYKVASVPNAEIVHLGGASSISELILIEQLFYTRFLYFKKTKRNYQIFFSFLLVFLRYIYKVILYTFTRKFKKREYYNIFFKMYFKQLNIFLLAKTTK